MDFKEIKELIKIFKKRKLNKLKIEDKDFGITLQKGFEGTVAMSTPMSTVPTMAAPIAQTIIESEEVDDVSKVVCGETVNSPMVGTFYASASPESPVFVKAGDMVKKGQTLCILEAMKIMNEVEAEYDFRVIEVLIKDATPVEYDMPLFLIEKM